MSVQPSYLDRDPDCELHPDDCGLYPLTEVTEQTDYVSLMGYIYYPDNENGPNGPWRDPSRNSLVCPQEDGWSVKCHLNRITNAYGYPADKVIFLLPFYFTWFDGSGHPHRPGWIDLDQERNKARLAAKHPDYLEKQDVNLSLAEQVTAYVTDPDSVRAKVQAALFNNSYPHWNNEIWGVGAWEIGFDTDTPEPEMTNALWDAAQLPQLAQWFYERNAGYYVGSGGGQVATPSGNGVVIPAGALAEVTDITVNEFAPSSVPQAPDGKRILAYAVRLLPEGQAFSTLVDIVLTYTDSDLKGVAPDELGAWVYDPGASAWQLAGGVLDPVAHTLTVQSTHFSLYAIMGPPAGPVGGEAELPDTADSQGNRPESPVGTYGALAGGAVAAAAVILTACGWYARRRWPR